jgi:hypothetical protein
MKFEVVYKRTKMPEEQSQEFTVLSAAFDFMHTCFLSHAATAFEYITVKPKKEEEDGG